MAYGNQTLGRGELHFSRFKTGTKIPEGFRYVGNTPSFTLSIAGTNLDHYSSDRGIREKDKSIVLETNRTGKFDADDIQLENLGWFFFGDSGLVTQTLLAGQSETFTDAIVGYSYQVGISDTRPSGVKSISAVVVKVGVANKTIATDYLVDLDRGIVTILEGGTILTGDDVIVEYTRNAKTYEQVISGTAAVEGALQFRSENPEGDKIDFFMPYVKLSPNGDFSLKADNAWQSLPFNVEILRAPAREAIYANGQPYTA